MESIFKNIENFAKALGISENCALEILSKLGHSWCRTTERVINSDEIILIDLAKDIEMSNQFELIYTEICPIEKIDFLRIEKHDSLNSALMSFRVKPIEGVNNYYIKYFSEKTYKWEELCDTQFLNELHRN